MSDIETAKSLFFEGLGFLDNRDYANAEARFRATLQLKPKSIPTLANLCFVLLNQEKYAEARNCAQEIILTDDNNIQAHQLLANCLVKERQFLQALAVYEKIVTIDPHQTDAHNNRGLVLNELKRYKDGLASFDQVISLAPNYADAHLNRGATLNRLGHYDEAIVSYHNALKTSPNLAAAYLGIGNTFFKLQRRDEALAAYDKALAIDRDFAAAWLGRANILAISKRFSESLEVYERALALDRNLTDAWIGRGNVLRELQRFDEALTAYDKALLIDGSLTLAWLSRGSVLYERQQYEESLAAYDKAIAIDVNLAEAWVGRANNFLDQRRHEEAVFAYDKAFSLKPDLKDVEGCRLYAQMNICDWRNFETDRTHLISGVRAGKRVSPPLQILALTSSAADQLQCAQLYASEIPTLSSGPLWQGERYKHDKIRIAYLSADFREHPVSLLMTGIFEQHDRTQFDPIAISFGSDNQSEMRARVKRSFGRFIDAANMNNFEVAQLLREYEIDIAIDLMGHTVGARPEILTARAVPIQVGYLGYPATTGANFIDYIFADRYAIPEEMAQHYSEKVVYLPDCFQANEPRIPIDRDALTRSDAGLPENGFVFCSFNNSYKFTPALFDVWMSLLRETEESVLWLVAPNAAVERNLRSEAVARGIEASRLIFAPRVEYRKYLAGYRLANLFLDTLPFNAGTTASDALWTGLPLITCSGEAFASRMAGSLLKVLQMPELIVQTLEDYKALALKLARDPKLIAALKARLLHNSRTGPLFDTTRFTHHIEAAYTNMWERYQREEPPTSFSVSPRLSSSE